MQFVLKSIQEGAELGGTTALSSRDPFKCRNGRLSELELAALRKEVEGGLAAQHKISPFAAPPFEHFRCSPINVVPKKGTDKFRLIHNLPIRSAVSQSIH